MIGSRHCLDPGLLWLWCRLAAAALIQPLAWEPPCAPGVTLKSTKKKKENFDRYAKKYLLMQSKYIIKEHHCRATDLLHLV